MSLSFRAGSFSSAGNASGGNLTLNKGTGTANGDRIKILVYFETDTCTITVSGGPWETKTIANTGAFKLQSFVKIASSEPASYTISNDQAGNQWRTACFAAYSGGTGSGTVLDAQSSTAQGDAQLETNQTAPTITPATNGVMVVWGYGNFDGTNPSATTGYCTNLRGALGSVAIADAYQSTSTATGTTRPNGGIGTTDYAAMHIALIADIASAAKAIPPFQRPFRVWRN